MHNGPSSRFPTRVLIMLLLLALMCVSCDLPVAFDELHETKIIVATGFDGTRSPRSTINDDPATTDVEHVYVKVFDSAGNYLQVKNPIEGLPGVTEMTYADGKWSATVKLLNAATGTITFVIWAENSSLGHLYSGSSQFTIDPAIQNTITIPTKTGYSIGDRGPAGGIIFYDKGEYTPYVYESNASEKWRYLEAAPKDYSNNFSWGSPGDNVANTVSDIGGGKHNTDVIVAEYPWIYNIAAWGCKDFTVNGFDDWFLPSKGEMEQLILYYSNSWPQRPLGLSDQHGTAYYHTSTQLSSNQNWTGFFRWNDETGEPAYMTEYNKSSAYIRPVRRF